MLLTTTFLAAALAGGPQPNPMLVDRAWLADRLKDPHLVILQVGDQTSKPDYDAGHIPGSQFLQVFTELAAPMDHSDPKTLMLELPAAERLEAALEAKGVSDDSYVVLVPARQYFSPTTRAYLTLTYAGLAGRVSILDGGLEAWRKEGRPVTADVPTVAPGRLTLHLDPGVVVGADEVNRGRGQAGIAVVDARDRQFYEGAPTRQARSGRIPGAVSVPYSSFFTPEGYFRPVAAIDSIFTAAGVKKDDRIFAYCHIGQQATAVWFAARLTGRQARLYDGSFDEWSRRSELPVESGRQP